jgi:DNA adenine methylase
MTTKTKKLRPPVKTHGGKYYLCNWIIQNFPEGYEKMTYCEPFCAGASVFLNKERHTPEPDSEEEAPEEVISDTDQGVIYIFKALRDEPQEFITRIKRTRYTERAFKMAQNKAEKGFDDYIDHAVNEYVLRRMSRGGLKTAFAWSERLRGGKPGDLNAWETMAKQLPLIAERVKDATVLCKDFQEIMKIWDEEDTLMYLDPPYLHSTRSDTDTYEHEMTVEDHIQLLNLAKAARGKVVISGYSSPLYNRMLKGWKVKRKNVANHSSQKKSKERRLEVLWMNY